VAEVIEDCKKCNTTSYTRLSTILHAVMNMGLEQLTY